MLANELIDRLERLGLLDQEIIEALREQLEQGGTRVTPEAVAKLLVDNGQLTHFQATKLIGELRSGEYQGENGNSAEEADLEIVPEEADAVVEASPVVEVVEAAPAEAVAVEAVPVEAAPMEAVPMSAAEVMTAEAEVPRRPQNVTRRRPDPEKSVWDSFKIYGYAGIIVLLILMGSGIWWVLTRESADEFVARADKAYNGQNYVRAQEIYLKFLDTYGEDHQYSSLARTRVAMTNLYRAAEFRNDPGRALEIERKQLPLIEKENDDGLNQERSNLAQLLVDVAKNIAEAAVDEKETEKKRDLLNKLDEQIEFTNNPLYVTSTVRVTLAGQLEEVSESRKRVQRDINRNVSLDKAEASMTKSLDEKKTKDAYDTRQRLVRDYPELFDNERLVKLIRRACGIQQELVEPSAKLPKVTVGEGAQQEVRSILLTTLTGGVSPELSGETLYFRAGGSILAFDGENGKLRWRKFVGYAKDLPPVRINDGDGVLLSESATKEILRCNSKDGEVQWRTGIEENFAEPISVKDDVYVSTESGRLIKLDADSGDAQWVSQIPQPLEIGPGVDERAQRLYLPGNHSNLYVINARDGSCIESYYLEHAEGTVAVPPIPLLGHLFVIENAGTDYVNIHVLKVDERGEQVAQAQPKFRLDGNVTVAPIIQGRRVIVLTDRGEVAVYDIEPTAENQKVNVVATGAPFYGQPTATRMAVEGGQMWITGTSVGRYELQINIGRVVPDWDIHAHDTFIGQPYAVDDALVHARVLRGTNTIRVTAANPKSGEEIWRTDVGVPVSMIKALEGGGFHVVTSQAALFKLDEESLQTGSTQGPIENPGDKAITIRFEDPVEIDAVNCLFINQVETDKLLVYAPQRPRELLRQVTLNISGGQQGGEAMVAGGGLFLPLRSGRAVLVDWRTGKMIASPFQPASDPTEEVTWTTPVRQPDDPDQLVIADSRKKIYRLRIDEQIRALATEDLEFPLLGPMAGVGRTAIATFNGPSADFVIGFDLTSLKEKFRSLLNSRVVWGPVAAGEFCLLQTDDSILHALAEDGSQKFEIQLPAGAPIGKPIEVGDSVVLAGATGWLIALDKSSGQLVGQSDLGQPISATPLANGDLLLVPGAEGVVYLTEVPGAP
ncbi:MAG: PQQ-binding-like beta-propeller repeat protein [Pirellulales bacterium]|nr:PQQ-binding-like beta-propeller repeat protein [Pirellulales bacterium]